MEEKDDSDKEEKMKITVDGGHGSWVCLKWLRKITL